MLIGDKKEFAIQFELNTINSNEWLFGKCCFWIGGFELGEFELGESLRDFLFSLEDILKFERSFYNEPIKSLLDLFRRLNNAVFLGAEVWDEASRFVFAPSLETFSHVKIFMMESNDEAWFIFSKSPYIDVREHRCKLKEVINVIELTIYELDNLLRSTEV